MRLTTTNAVEVNRWEKGVNTMYLSGNNLPWIKLICGKLFPDRYLLPMTAYWFQQRLFVLCRIGCVWVTGVDNERLWAVEPCKTLPPMELGLRPFTEQAVLRPLRYKGSVIYFFFLCLESLFKYPIGYVITQYAWFSSVSFGTHLHMTYEFTGC